MLQPTLLVATWEQGLFALTSDGNTHEIANEPVAALASDGRGGALALVGQHSLRWRAPDGEWTTIATSEFDLSCCMRVQDTIYVGTNDARMLWLTQPGGDRLRSGVLACLDGFDNVAGRDTWFAGSAIVNGQRLGPPLGIRSLAANANGSVLFANVHVGGIPRSMDGGITWQPTIDIHSDVHEVRAHPSHPDIVAAVAAVGLCVSRDSGATWVIEQEGLHAAHCSAIAFLGDDIIFSASVDPFAVEGRIYRRPVKPEGRLTAVEGGGMPAWTKGIVDTGCISASGSAIAVAARTGIVYTSDDCGRNWSRRSQGLPAPSGVLLLGR